MLNNFYILSEREGGQPPPPLVADMSDKKSCFFYALPLSVSALATYRRETHQIDTILILLKISAPHPSLSSFLSKTVI